MRDDLETKNIKNCIFHGFCNDTNYIFDHIDLLCMPSRFEGLPMAALESMRAGKPVLASNIGGLPELIHHGDNGFLAGKHNINCFKKSLQQWISMSQQDKKTMACNAHKTIEDNYNAEVEINKILTLYEQKIKKDQSNACPSISL